MTTRKTPKFYREELAKQHSLTSLTSLIKEIITKYGNGSDKSIYLKGECNWNHRLTCFKLSSKGEILVVVYWQGDSTDGDEYVGFSDIYNATRSGRDYVIKAEHYFDGYRTRCTHGDIRVDKDELDAFIKLLAGYLSPEEIKKRKEQAKISKMVKEVHTIISQEYYPKYSNTSMWSKNEEYCNGRGAINQLLKEHDKELVKKTTEEIRAIIDKVFKANYRSDYNMKKDKYGCIVYDISY